MNDLSFDEEKLAIELSERPNQLQVAFAAACAERLLPAYTHFAERAQNGDSKELTSILERLWQDLEGYAMTTAEIDEAIEKCMLLNPGLDESQWIEGWEAADDAAAALCYALRCRKSGESQEAAWAARCCYETLDNFVINLENIDTNQPGAEQRALSHSLIQAELARQRRDLEDLLNFEGTKISSVVARLRERSRAAAVTFFGLNP